MDYLHDWLKEFNRKIDSGEANCHNCVYAETFVPRSDESSAHGCRRPGIEGYVLDPDNPRCVLRLDWHERKEHKCQKVKQNKE